MDELAKKKISGSDLARFHESRGVTNISCNRCGNSTWMIQSTDDDPSYAVINELPKNERSVKGMDLLVLGCQNCANLWIMAYDTVAEWIEANP